MQTGKQNTLLVAGSILAAGIVIALGIIFAGSGTSVDRVQVDEESLRSVAISEVNDSDHIIGSRDAKVIMVEYSDIGCTHCQALHETMERVVEEYDGSDFAWIFRHLPFRAPTEAHASECVADIAGEEAFWGFMSSAMKNAQTSPVTSEAELTALATSIPGVTKDAFEACQDDAPFVEDIQQDATEAQQAGAQGTPFNVFILQDGLSEEKESLVQNFLGGNARVSEDKTKLVVSGALPYEGMKALIDILLTDN